MNFYDVMRHCNRMVFFRPMYEMQIDESEVYVGENGELKKEVYELSIYEYKDLFEMRRECIITCVGAIDCSKDREALNRVFTEFVTGKKLETEALKEIMEGVEVNDLY